MVANLRWTYNMALGDGLGGAEAWSLAKGLCRACGNALRPTPYPPIELEVDIGVEKSRGIFTLPTEACMWNQAELLEWVEWTVEDAKLTFWIWEPFLEVARTMGNVR